MLKDKIKIWIAIIVLTIIAVTSAVSTYYLFDSKIKIAYVDNARILTEYRGIIEGKKIYEEKIKQWQSNLDTLEREIDSDILAYKNNYENMAPKERELTEKLIESKKQNYFSYKKAITEKGEEEDQKLTSEVLNQINSYITQYGESHDYDFILGITEMGNLLYAKKHADITDEIIEKMNKNYEGK